MELCGKIKLKLVWEDLKDNFSSPSNIQAKVSSLPLFKEIAGVDMRRTVSSPQCVTVALPLTVKAPDGERLHTVAFHTLDLIIRKVTLISDNKKGHRVSFFNLKICHFSQHPSCVQFVSLTI